MNFMAGDLLCQAENFESVLIRYQESVKKGNEVTIWLFNNSVYLVPEGVAENIQAPGLPNLEDLMLFLTMTKTIPIYIGVACAMGRGLVSEKQEVFATFVCGELGMPSQLADLIVAADNVIGF